jgi:hypothetical protein
MDNVIMVIIAILGSYDGGGISVNTTEVSKTTCEAMKEKAKYPPEYHPDRSGRVALTVYCLPK